MSRMLRVLYKSLLRAARVYDAHPWNRAHLFAEPAIHRHLPSIDWYLGTSPCQHLVRTAFRQPPPSSPSPSPSPSPSQLLPQRLSAGFAVLRALRSNDFQAKLDRASGSPFSDLSGASTSASALDRDGFGQEGEEEEEDEEFEEEEDDEESIASEAEALLESTEYESTEASILRSALSHFGQVQLLSAPSSPAQVLKLTLHARPKDGDSAGEDAGGGLRLNTGEGDRRLLAMRQKQREIQAEEDEEEEGVEGEEEDDEARLEEDLADLHLAAHVEAKVDDATLLALHPFIPPQLSALHDHHARLQSLLTAPAPDEDEVDEAVHWFLAPDSDCPRHLRLTCEDYHRVLNHWMDRREYSMEEDEEEEVAQPEAQQQQPQEGTQETEEVDEDEDEDDEESRAREEAQSRLRLRLFIRMKESGYAMKRSLVKRLLKEASREGGAMMAMVLLRETAFGRLPASADVDATLRVQRLRPFDAAMRGEHVDWDVPISAPRRAEVDHFPLVPHVKAGSRDSAHAEDDELQSSRKQLLADGPLLELVIDASADAYYTDDVRASYPDALMTVVLDQPPTPSSAYLAPLTPSTSPSSLPHVAVELFSLMLLHSIPFTRRSTVTSLLYVSNELQLPSLASLVLLKAHHDGIRISPPLLNNLITIACNSSHLHLALHTLTLYTTLHLPLPSAQTFSTIFNLAVYGQERVIDAGVVDKWARGRGLVMTGWGGGGRTGRTAVGGEGGPRSCLRCWRRLRGWG